MMTRMQVMSLFSIFMIGLQSTFGLGLIDTQDQFGSSDCTIGVASGYVTVDGRPLLWKVRDTDETNPNCISYVEGSPYDYIGVHGIGKPVYMGLNEVGVATGNSSVTTPGSGNTNSMVQRHILRNFDNMDQIRDYWRSTITSGACNATGCFPFIDAMGNASIFEVNRSHWALEYNSMDPNRESQGLLGFVVRANEFHESIDGTDDILAVHGRYQSGTYNVAGLVHLGILSVQTIVQGNNDQYGFEFHRYGPDQVLTAISRDYTRSVMTIHGVTPDEDPTLSTMWIILGQSNFGIAVPVWVPVTNIPPCLANGDMYGRANSLFIKGDEESTQASVFPAEAHLFNVVINKLLPHWRNQGVPTVIDMMRIEHQMANDAYSLLDCLDNVRHDNQAPTVSISTSIVGMLVYAEVQAEDTDGYIAAVEWDFGDEQLSVDTSIMHTYDVPGQYLVSCTVIDDHGVSMTDWNYIVIESDDMTN
jgi:hypothetical protein